MNESLFLKINSWAGQNIWLDKFLVFSADWLGYFLIAGVVLFYLKERHKYQDMALVSLGSAIVARFGLVTAIRYLYYNPRPFVVLQNINILMNHETKSSFPSGHASFYFALAMGVYFYNRKLGYLFFVFAGLMGFARIFVGVHWPLDILAGAVLGMATVFIINFLYKKMPRKALS